MQLGCIKRTAEVINW